MMCCRPAIGFRSVFLAFLVASNVLTSDPALGQERQKDSVVTSMDTVQVMREMPGAQGQGRSFSGEDIRTHPGLIGDPVRSVEVSGEVLSSSDLQAIPMIAGDGAESILTLLDGFPVTFPYRFLGGFSLFNPLTTGKVELLSDGYPVSYGGYAPTAVRVTSSSTYAESPGVQTSVNLLSSALAVQLPLSDSMKWFAKIAARTSHVGLAADLLSGSNSERLRSFMPNLKDVQLFFSEAPSANLYSFQELIVSRENGSLSGIDRMFDYSWKKEFAGIALITGSGLWTSEHRLSWSHDDISLSTVVPIEYIGSGRFDIGAQFTKLRLQSQLHYSAGQEFELAVGSDIGYAFSDVGFLTFSSWLNGRSPLSSQFGDVAAFSEMRWQPGEGTALKVGVRGTYFGFVRMAGFESRGSAEIGLGSGSMVRISVGQYLRPPSDFEILHGFLTFLAMPNQTPLMMLMSDHRDALRPEEHRLVAFEAHTSVADIRSMEVGAEVNAYYKEAQSLILPARYPSIFTPLDTLSFDPLQTFRAVKWGVGLTTRLTVTPLNLFLTASVFTHHSKVGDRRAGNEFLAPGDVPLVSKVLVRLMPPGWIFTLLYQFATGSPTTDSYYLKGNNLVGDVVYLPLWKELNSSRVSDYHRVDLSVAKTWFGPNWKIEVMCSVLNFAGSRNVSNYRYEFSADAPDYVNKSPVLNTLPWLPNVEVRFEYAL